VRHPFGVGGAAAFDFDAFEQVVATQVRALDNVLDVTFWPLQQQRDEAAAKRRIGVGFTGLGNTLAMLKLRYDREDGRAMAAEIGRRMRDAAYRASVELAKEKGAFPVQRRGLSGRRHLCQPPARGHQGGHPPARHPQQPPAVDRAHRHRQSGLCRQRLQRHRAGLQLDLQAQQARGRRQHQQLHGGRPRLPPVPRAGGRQRHGRRRRRQLPAYFVNALQMSAQEHMAMMQAVQPFVDTSISKTVNIPADYPFGTSRTCTARPGRPA
jgi:ribonucleoside-diphosphate reductase alpha chain